MKTKLNFLVVLTLLAVLFGANTGTAAAQTTITLSPDTLPAAVYRTAYSQQLTASGGSGSYSFSLLSGTLPNGFTLSTDGLISGFLDGALLIGTYPITIQVQDANSVSASFDYNLVLDKATPTISVWTSYGIAWGYPFNIVASAKAPDNLYIGGTVDFAIDGVPVAGCQGVADQDGYFFCEGVSINPDVGEHTLTASFTPADADFYNAASGSGPFTVEAGSYYIWGYVFSDANKNGAKDSEEYGLGSWKLNFTTCDGDPVMGTNGTDIGPIATSSYGYVGEYMVDYVPGGQCVRLSEEVQPGWQPTTDTSMEFTLSQGVYPINFGNYYPTITILGPAGGFPTGNVGVPFNPFVFTATGGEGTYSYTLGGGKLPTGLELSTDGTLSGTPTLAGGFSFAVNAEDENHAVGKGYFFIQIMTDGTFTLTSSSTPSAPFEAVTFTFSAEGEAYHYYLTKLVPPYGLVTFQADGEDIAGCTNMSVNISNYSPAKGYPAVCTTSSLGPGTHEITASFTDSPGYFHDATLTLEQQVGQPATYTISGSIFRDYNRDGLWNEGDHMFSPSGRVYLNQGCDDTVEDYTTLLADSQYAFDGLSGGECYLITVEIDESGMKQYTELTDFTLNGDMQIDIGFNYPLITITPPPGTEGIPAEIPSPIVGEAYYQKFTVSGGDEPYAYKIVTSYLPDGLTLSEVDGVLVLSGTPTKGGLYGFGVDVWDKNGAPLLDADGYPAPAYYALVIKTDAVFTFTSSANPSAPGEAVTFTVSASGDAVILNKPMPPVGWVTFSADGNTIDQCSDLLLNVGASEPGNNPVTCITAALEAGSHQITVTYTDALEAMMGYRVYNTPSLAPLTQVVGEPLNTAPLANPGGPYLGPINTAIDFDGSGSSDPDGDPLTYAWDFGDGAAGSGASPAHTYSAAGIYNACLTVSDGTVAFASACMMAVVYDPSAGFVTGGGWIDSPAGAYLPEPTLSGKATFGFVSKYKKGASLPEGNTAFQFDVGDFEFYSSAYDWLVVSKTGSTAQFKGSGLVNGGLDPNGNAYKFMLWAGDGSPDTFRIRIWWEADGIENVVYDNGFDQAIGGGSIVVHTGK